MLSIIYSFLLFFNLYGKSDSQEIIWAGIEGNYPKYIDQGKLEGLGYAEFYTREIQKSLEANGFTLRHEYMTYARVEHELNSKSPICFFPMQVKNVKEYLAKHPSWIFSIPLLYSGDEVKKIIFKKGNEHKFKKHQTIKGDIDLSSLIKDKALKTVFVAGVDYSLNTKKAIEENENVEEIVTTENNQIIQMLENNYIDYYFEDKIEYEDYKMTKGKNYFNTLAITYIPIRSISDPNLIFNTIVCGMHKIINKAMPIINETILLQRSTGSFYDRNNDHYRKFNPDYKVLRLLDTLMTQLADPSSHDVLNSIFPTQKVYQSFEKTQKWKDVDIKINSKKITPPRWLIFQLEEGNILICNEVDLAVIHSNIMDEKFNGEYFDDEGITSMALKRYINYFDGNEITTIKKLDFYDSNIEKNYLDINHDFLKLNFSKINILKKLTIIGAGLTKDDGVKLTKELKWNYIESLNLFSLSNDLAEQIVHFIPTKLKELNLLQSNFFKTKIENKIEKMNFLKKIVLYGTTLDKNGFEKIMMGLSEEIREIHMGSFQSVQWTKNLALGFSRKSFPNLKKFYLKSMHVNDLLAQLILKSIPDTLESLTWLDTTTTLYGFKEFLEKKLDNMKEFKISQVEFPSSKDSFFKIPINVEKLSMTNCGLDDGKFKKIKFPRQIKSLNLHGNYITDISMDLVLNNLHPKMGLLRLSSNKIVGKFFKNWSKKNTCIINEVREMHLNDNLIDDQGLFDLLQCNPYIEEFFLQKTKITDDSLVSLTKKRGKDLVVININNCDITKNGINSLMKNISEKMKVLKLSSLLSIDVDSLVRYMPKNLVDLDVSNNYLSDLDMEKLSKVLPSHLRFLNLENSSFQIKGTTYLIEHMPRLLIFSFGGFLGPASLKMISKNLSPFLIMIGDDLHVNDYIHLVMENIPRFLWFFSILDVTGCEKYISKLPSSLFYFMGDLSNINLECAKAFKGKFPKNLQAHLVWGDIKNKNAMQVYLNNMPKGKFQVNLYSDIKSEKTITNILDVFTYFNQVNIRGGPVSLEFFKKLKGKNLSHIMIQNNNITGKYLEMIPNDSLENLYRIDLNNNRINGIDFAKFIKRVNPYISHIDLTTNIIQDSELDIFLQALPKHLRLLKLGGNLIGEKGFKKIIEYKKKRGQETGFTLQVFGVDE